MSPVGRTNRDQSFRRQPDARVCRDRLRACAESACCWWGATREEDDEVFETEAEAEQHGQQVCSDYSQGATVLHLHNPGDYPDPDDEIDYEVIEVDDED